MAKLCKTGVLIRYLLANIDKEKALDQNNIKSRTCITCIIFKDRDLNKTEDTFR